MFVVPSGAVHVILKTSATVALVVIHELCAVIITRTIRLKLNFLYVERLIFSSSVLNPLYVKTAAQSLRVAVDKVLSLVSSSSVSNQAAIFASSLN